MSTDALTRPGILPDDAARRFAAICDATEDANDLSHSAQLRAMAERTEVQTLTAQIEHYERQPNWRRSDPGYRALVRSRDDARRERDAAQGRMDRKFAASGALTSLRTNLQRWLVENDANVIVPHAHPAPKLGKGESPADAVNRCRQAVQATRGERRKVGSAPVPSAQAKAAARAFVAETAALARPDVSSLLAGVATVAYPALAELPVLPVINPDFGMIASGARVRDGLALACWLTPDAVIAALDGEIDATADDARAMTAEAKAARLAELDAALLKIERDEAAFIRMVEDQGGTLDHRPDIDPRAILQVEVADADGVLAL